MKFSYSGYRELLRLLNDNKYSIVSYIDWKEKNNCIILRHDIDNDLKKAVNLAELENHENVQSTYFALISSDFYNVFSLSAKQQLNRIIEMGHNIGLHFDEVQYPELTGNLEALKEKIIEECQILEKAIDHPVKVVSMHRPSQLMLDADLQIPGIINSYGMTFFKEFKYLSDSRRRWREPVEEIIKSQKYDKLHILTHAFWYGESEKSINETVADFVNRGSKDRYSYMADNITDLNSIMTMDQIRG